MLKIYTPLKLYGEGHLSLWSNVLNPIEPLQYISFPYYYSNFAGGATIEGIPILSNNNSLFVGLDDTNPSQNSEYSTIIVNGVNPYYGLTKYDSNNGNVSSSFPDLIFKNFGNNQLERVENSGITKIVSQSDGKLIIATSTGNYARASMIKFDPITGEVDNNWRYLVGSAVPNGNVNEIVTLPDGNVLIGGNFTTYSGSTALGLVKMNSTNTSFDPNFKTGSGFKYLGGTAEINSIDLEPNGKIIVGGIFNFYSSSNYIVSGVVRLNPNGDIDETFKTSGVSDSFVSNNVYVYSVKRQNDGKIVIGGLFTSYSGSNANSIIRTNASGAVDPDFISGSGIYSTLSPDIRGTVSNISIQSDNKILVTGNFTGYSGSASKNIVRIMPSGSKDDDFKVGGGFDVYSPGITHTIDQNGNIYCVGYFNSYSGSYPGLREYVIKINPSGSIDSNFKSTGSRYFDVAPQNVAGSGVDNPSFFNYWPINRLVKTSDGGYAILGSIRRFSTSSAELSGFLKLTSGLNLPSNYDIYTASFSTQNTDNYAGDVYNMKEEPNGKIIFVGNFKKFKNQNTNRIIRVNSDFTVDSTFKSGSGFDGTFDYVYAIDLEPSTGKIYAGGSFSNYSGSSSNNIVKINPSGSVDTAFDTNSGTGFNSTVRKILVQSDEKVLIGGSFSSYNGSNYRGIIRLNSDGTVDSNFKIGTGSGTGGSIYNIVSQSDGKILLMGQFTGYSGSSNYKDIIRINGDGSVDETFNSGTGLANGIFVSAVTSSDGGYIVSYVNLGNTNVYDGASIPGSGASNTQIFKINNNGSLNESFITKVDALNSANTRNTANIAGMEYTTDGALLVVGSFLRINGTLASGMAKINPADGDLWRI